MALLSRPPVAPGSRWWSRTPWWAPLPASLLAIAWMALAPAPAQGAAGEYEVKAAFLYNFAKFVEWPPEAFSEPQAPLSFCIVGEDPFGEGLEEAVAGESAGGRRILVRRPDRDADLRRCHVLFIARSERTHEAQILSPLRGRPVFTVGESAGFLEAGGLLRFVLVDRKVRFEINRPALDGTSLKVSSKLLRLAVSSGEASPGS